MTEAQWLAETDPARLLNWLRLARRPSERKLRLFACACTRRGWHLLTREPPRAAVETAERYADGLVGPEELRQGWSAVRKALSMAPLHTAWELALTAALHATAPGSFFPEFGADVVAHALSDDPRAESPGYLRERAFQCDLLRDLFNPFAAAGVSADRLTWGGGVAVAALARAAHEDRQLPTGLLDPARLAVLADALEEAGCDDAGLLAHLRGPGPHARGCWVLDLILGKS